MAFSRTSFRIRALGTLAITTAPWIAIVAYSGELDSPWNSMSILGGFLWSGFWLQTLWRDWGHRLRTLSSVLAAYRENDFTVQARQHSGGDALDHLFTEVNALGERLRNERMQAQEATALLAAVVKELDVALFAFDRHRRLRFINPAGERLLPPTNKPFLGMVAEHLHLDVFLAGDSSRIVEHAFIGGFGRWQLQRRSFREGGVPHQLVVLTDLSQTLREEERGAWKRLLRVLGHELKNSLAPMKSIAASLPGLLDRKPRPDDWEDDVRRGLRVIGSRAESLNQFLDAFATVARLPAPERKVTRMNDLLHRVAALEWPVKITLSLPPDWTLLVDAVQIEQALINLTKNASEASQARGETPLVEIVGEQFEGTASITITDNGAGLANEDNLFVPFFTTKRRGTGVGLFISRQIAEAHGGYLTLHNRHTGGPGCCAMLTLPIDQQSQATQKRSISDTRIP